MNNPHQSCQTCEHWMPIGRNPLVGMCSPNSPLYTINTQGKNCGIYQPLTDGEEVIRRGQAIMEAECKSQT